MVCHCGLTKWDLLACGSITLIFPLASFWPASLEGGVDLSSSCLWSLDAGIRTSIHRDRDPLAQLVDIGSLVQQLVHPYNCGLLMAIFVWFQPCGFLLKGLLLEPASAMVKDCKCEPMGDESLSLKQELEPQESALKWEPSSIREMAMWCGKLIFTLGFSGPDKYRQVVLVVRIGVWGIIW